MRLLRLAVICIPSLVLAADPLLGGLFGDPSTPTPSSNASSPATTTTSSLGPLLGLPLGQPHSSSSASPTPTPTPTPSPSKPQQRPSNVVVTSTIGNVAASASSSNADNSDAPDSDDADGQQHLITGVIVICCVVVATTIAIFIFRRIKLKFCVAHSTHRRRDSPRTTTTACLSTSNATYLCIANNEQSTPLMRNGP
ncbi:hypothetical protein INT43_002355 [Umbelopsis isabellina]|uniref:Uncharacterized protein n=1 Tax=Mortierella isabellina TaxID=91625 RepID=A0A8H7UL96_MORIS|nr:hypothetical protein INT43_002355 [Umbelopsis isabellina]